ncbi:MAG: hypothetical protein LUE64_04335 [Candidatus Gastranaerophilales bacterium]|nr:hypothetical protein [Candidatus Gastranaerophilales bacterium]
MNYVMHYCRNKNCNNGWIDKDLTSVKTYPPAWKYCRECAERMGIGFEKQKPSDYRSEEEKEITNLKLQKSIQARRLKQCF